MEEDAVLYLRWLCIYKVQFLQAPNIFLDSMDYFCFPYHKRLWKACEQIFT